MATAIDLRSQINHGLFTGINDRADTAFSDYLHDQGDIDPRYVDKTIPSRIAREQADMAESEVVDEYSDLTEDNVMDKVQEFVAENYDADFLQGEIEKKFDMDTVRENLTEELLLLLDNTSPYDTGSRSYYATQARSASLRDLAKYTANNDAESFIETYAPDWQESAE